VLRSLRAHARHAVVERAVGGSEVPWVEVLVQRRLKMLDPVPRVLIGFGECAAAIPGIGARIPGGKQYCDVVGGLATAFVMERAEEAK